MSQLVQQLAAASAQASALAAEKASLARVQAEQKAKRSAAQKQSWGIRIPKTGLVQILLDRLPSGRDNAISLAQIEALLNDLPHAPTGISSALCGLCKNGDVQRTGLRRAYLYYLKP